MHACVMFDGFCVRPSTRASAGCTRVLGRCPWIPNRSAALLQGAAAGPLHPRAGALPLDPNMMLSHIEGLMCMPPFCHAASFCCKAWCAYLHIGTGLVAGGVLGEPAWVPLIGGAGAKRPASRPAPADRHRGCGGDAPGDQTRASALRIRMHEKCRLDATTASHSFHSDGITRSSILQASSSPSRSSIKRMSSGTTGSREMK